MTPSCTRRALLGAVAGAVAPAALSGCAGTTRSMRENPVALRAGWGQAGLLAKAEAALLEARASVALCFGPPPPADLEVRLVHAFSVPAAPGVAARYDPARRVIEVLLPDGPAPMHGPASWQGSLWHEYVHHVVHQTAGGEPVPAWFDEGTAECFGKYRSGVVFDPYRRGLQFLDWVRTSRVPRFAELDRMIRGTDHGRGYTAYAFAYTAVAHVVERFGEGAPARCLAAVRERYSLGGALRREYGVRLADLEADWRAALVARYSA
jgi:hypothetical protein